VRTPRIAARCDPERFAERAGDVGGRDCDEAAAALQNVDESLRRADFMFYTAKRWTEEQYLAELDRLQAIRDELSRAARPTRPPLTFTSVLDAWASGDPQTRLGLLREVFEALDVDGGLIVAYVPRSDRAAEVVSLFGDTWQPRSERDSNPRSRLSPLTAFPVRRPRPARRSLRRGLYPGPARATAGGGGVGILPRRRGVRVVEGAALEKRCAGNGTVGSNPTPSAIDHVVGK
jgi:hypothetical protein